LSIIFGEIYLGQRLSKQVKVMNYLKVSEMITCIGFNIPEILNKAGV